MTSSSVGAVADATASTSFSSTRWAVAVAPVCEGAAIIGRVVAEYPGMVLGKTAFGTVSVIERELGEQLPRIR